MFENKNSHLTRNCKENAKEERKLKTTMHDFQSVVTKPTSASLETHSKLQILEPHLRPNKPEIW